MPVIIISVFVLCLGSFAARLIHCLAVSLANGDSDVTVTDTEVTVALFFFLFFFSFSFFLLPFSESK